MAAYLPFVNHGFARFFTSAQDASWYRHFLNPALEELQTLSVGSNVLDVGTGPGKFIELVQNSFDLECVGVDVDDAMLEQARKRPALADVSLIKINPNQGLPFDDETFDAICFCSVLFLLEHPLDLLNEAFRLLQPGGKIVVLTPTGNGSLLDGIEAKSGTFYIWRKSTSNKAREWKRRKMLSGYAKQKNILYHKRYGFSGFAVVETLQKKT